MSASQPGSDPGQRPRPEAVLFDWGGTLTPWHTIDPDAEARALAAAALDGDEDAPLRLAGALQSVWGRSRDHHTSATVADVFTEAGLAHDASLLAGYREFWAPHTATDPDVLPTKPAPEAFLAAVEAVGVHDPAACVFVGDRLFDDVWGAANVGMRTIHVPHSDIPRAQVGHTEGTPDAVVGRLAEVYDVVRAWRSED